jgi:chaperonin GroEL
MGKKVFDNGSTLNSKIISGVNKLADAVTCTLGPKGRNVVIHPKGKNPFITKDGVTVASHVELDDPFENVGAQVIKQASFVSAQEAGDGTTTATVLSRAIINHAQKYLASGASPVSLKRGMDYAVEEIVEKLKEMSKPIKTLEDIQHVATISANGDKQIGKLIAMAIDKAGRDGAVTIEEGRSLETTLDIIEGFQMSSGFVSQQFVTDERKHTMRYDNALVLVTDHSVDSLDELMPALEIAAREAKPFVVVAENVEGQALAALILNTVRGNMRVAAIKAPSYGQERKNILSDLALSVGATFFSRESGKLLKEITREDLGSVKSVEAFKNWSTFVGGSGNYDDVEKRIESLKSEILQTSDISECEKIQERITRLASGVAIIKVGGLTEVDMIERKHRIEDALAAVKSAQQEGILPGGGIALLRIAQTIQLESGDEDEDFGRKVVFEACHEPLRNIASNCGESSDVIVNNLLDESKCKGDWTGYNFASGEYVGMYESGIIDPAKVTRCALQNAVSAASTLLTTAHAIIEV